MKKKSNMRTTIRQIVREEVAMAIREVITELKQPTQQVSQPKPKKKIIEKKEFTKNSILNEVMNETAASDEWKTMGGEAYDSSKVNEVMSSQYGDLMNNGEDANNGEIIATPNAPEDIKNLFNKDYSGILKASIQKSKDKRG